VRADTASLSFDRHRIANFQSVLYRQQLR
jgi:hypothetical protein